MGRTLHPLNRVRPQSTLHTPPLAVASTCQESGGTLTGWTWHRPAEGRPRGNVIDRISLQFEYVLCKRKKEMTMAHWLEDLTKTMADEKMGRRTAMRHVAGTVAGI